MPFPKYVAVAIQPVAGFVHFGSAPCLLHICAVPTSPSRERVARCERDRPWTSREVPPACVDMGACPYLVVRCRDCTTTGLLGRLPRHPSGGIAPASRAVFAGQAYGQAAALGRVLRIVRAQGPAPVDETQTLGRPRV
jgi:hypothetical protein